MNDQRSQGAAREERGAGPSNNKTLIVFLLSGLIITGLAFLYLFLPEIRYGDTILYWQIAKDLSPAWLADPPGWGHFSSRFGVNLVAALAHWLLGDGPLIYYVAPFAITLVLTAAFFLVCLRCGSILIAVVATLCLIAHPGILVEGVRILPGIFSACYILASIYFVIRCFEIPDRLWIRIGLAALLAGLAYLSRLPNLFFVPAIVLGIWMVRRDWRDVALFCGVLFAVYVVEWIYYFAVFENYTWGRLSVPKTGEFASYLRRQHGGVIPEFSLIDLFSYRYQPKRMGGLWPAITFYGSVLSAVLLIARSRHWRSVPSLLAIVLLSYTVINGLAVVRFDPLIPAQVALVRYLAPLVPLQLLVIAFALAGVGDWWSEWRRRHSSNRSYDFLGRSLGVLALAGLLVAFVSQDWRHVRRNMSLHPFDEMLAYQTATDEIRRSGRLILFEDTKALRFFAVLNNLDRKREFTKLRKDKEFSHAMVTDSFIRDHGDPAGAAQSLGSNGHFPTAVFSIVRGGRKDPYRRFEYMKIKYGSIPAAVFVDRLR